MEQVKKAGVNPEAIIKTVAPLAGHIAATIITRMVKKSIGNDKQAAYEARYMDREARAREAEQIQRGEELITSMMEYRNGRLITFTAPWDNPHFKGGGETE